MNAGNTACDSHKKRLITLDVIRGVAVMGIFSVNVVAMAMIQPAYFYPLSYGYESALDGVTWALNFTLIEGKMRSLFSMLFGASMLLMIDRAEAAGRSAAVSHYARMVVLLLIGLIHFYLIWWGDILAVYALIGMIAFLVRRQTAQILLILSLLLFSVEYVPALANAPDRLQAQAAALKPAATPEEKHAWERRVAWVHPSREDLARDAAAHRSPASHFQSLLSKERRWELLYTIRALLFETLALMLLGMAAFRSGFLSGAWGDRTYRSIAFIGLGVGIVAFAALTLWVVASGFREGEALAAYFDLSGPFRPMMALGYAALIILLFRSPGALRDRLAAVGRCAFTNYLGASVVGVLVFFGVGLDLYGKVSRAEAWLLVPAVWAAMLLWSKPWLDRFNLGPLEWLWRSAARWELQPIRRTS